MDNEEIKIIYSKIFKNISLWASQSFIRSVIVILTFIIFGLPLLETLQNLVINFPYVKTGIILYDFIQKNFNISNYIFSGVLIIIIAILYWMYRQIINTRLITDKFKGKLNSWAIPLGASWTTQSCKDKLSKMLTVTNSNIPGTLKGAYWWYDYEITFETKISGDSSENNQNFTVVIRSENNFNCIMLQFTTTHLRPHLVYNGTFIVDNNAEQLLPTVLNINEWIKVKLIVKGNLVNILLNSYEIQYNIPTKILSVENTIMSKGTITLQEMEISDNNIKEKQRRIFEILSMPPSAAREEAVKTVPSIFEGIPPFSNIILEYQKGSVGFRECGNEKAHFIDFCIKRI